jgi:ferric-dicitrate binding protein FerR (iron transport regulator)
MERPTPTEEQIALVFRELAEQRSDELARSSIDHDWRRLQGKWQDEVRQRTSPWSGSRLGQHWFGLGVAAAAAASIVIALWIWPAQQALSYEIAANGQTTVDGEWIRTNGAPATLDFSDGSELQIDANSVLDVDILGEHSARTRLESGRLHASVHHADQTNWVFVAGPYEVYVVGTSFDLAWQDSEFTLTMHEGQVEVAGPDEKRWTLKRGEVLNVPNPTPRQPVAEPETHDAPEAPPAAEPDEGPPTRQRASASPAAKTARDIETDDEHAKQADRRGRWQAMLGKGLFEDIVNDARTRGVDSVLASGSPAELAALAQAAGYSGKTALAERTWNAIRSNHSGSASARRGAFFLARLEERRGDSSDAVRWLETYLREAPNGALAVEARGRRLVLVRRMQGPTSAKARTLARDYLKRHPEGSYAETARATLRQR